MMPDDKGSSPYGAEVSKATHYGEDGYEVLLIDEPSAGIRRLTLNRPEKRNALNHQLRGELLHAQADRAYLELHLVCDRVISDAVLHDVSN